MPELPELEVVREVLARRLAGRRIEQVTLAPRGGRVSPRVPRAPPRAPAPRRGKFLLLTFAGSPYLLAVNPKLTGRFQLCAPSEPKAGPVHVVLRFNRPAEELRNTTWT